MVTDSKLANGAGATTPGKNFWKQPPLIKIFEALGTLGDKDRIKPCAPSEKQSEDKLCWRVYSSERNKFYLVKANKDLSALIANDNGSYWQGYLGYPMIAVLLQEGLIKFNRQLADDLRGIPWKKINTRFKNNYEKTTEYCLDLLERKGWQKKEVLKEINKIRGQLNNLKIKKLGPRIPPP